MPSIEDRLTIEPARRRAIAGAMCFMPREYPAHIHCENVVEFFQRSLGNRLDQIDTGIVDQHVDPAVPPFHAFRQRLPLRLAAHVEPFEPGHGADPLRRGLALYAVDVGNHYTRSLLGQQRSYGVADAAGASRDDGQLAADTLLAS